MDQFASHLPVLSVVLRKMAGLLPFPILEIGCGYYSTPLLSAYSAAGNCRHHILESDEAWAKGVIDLLSVSIEIHPAMALPKSATSIAWGFAFIDSKPGESRIVYARELRNYTRAILLHDSNPDWDRDYRYSEILGDWKHHRQFSSLYPHSLLLTDDSEVWNQIVD